jgi:hypothetical protein
MVMRAVGRRLKVASATLAKIYVDLAPFPTCPQFAARTPRRPEDTPIGGIRSASDCVER